MHFVIQAPNLAQMYINMLRTFSDIGPLEILYVRHIGFQNGRHLKSTFAIISGHNAAIDLILVSKCMFLGQGIQWYQLPLNIIYIVCYIIVFGNYLGKYWIQHNTLKRMF